MKNLIVCCDGTWDTPEQTTRCIATPSNVVRLHNAVAEKDEAGNDQLEYYHPGVGTEGHWWQKVAGGALGTGLDQNIMSAYRWLGSHYEDGDNVYAFGFSRGAFTARSLIGLIGACGLLDLSGLPETDIWPRIEASYNLGYRQRKPKTDWASPAWALHRNIGGDVDGSIHFLGVWDTVGALGIPNDMAIANLFDDPTRWAFHDTKLSSAVANARQALALDEQRASFSPTLWTNVSEREGVKQLWFPGVHCDVGGGYPETGLSDGALKWMLEEAQACGLALHPDMLRQVKPDSLGVLHDSDTGLYQHLRIQPRSIPNVAAHENASSLFHKSALDRHRSPPIAQAPYRATVTLSPGQSRSVAIYANKHWNHTGIFLEAGASYEFQAAGQWIDRTLKCGPDGVESGHFQVTSLKHLLGSFVGDLEKIYKACTHNEKADLAGSRREETMPWGALVGAIANGGNPGADGSPTAHETFPIGSHAQYPASGDPEAAISTGGYLLCFVNDTWYGYGNNRGSLTLTVKRLG